MAEEVQFTGGNDIQHIRLSEEIENPNSATSQSLMDENLLQYYKFWADKGDVQAQVRVLLLYCTVCAVLYCTHVFL